MIIRKDDTTIDCSKNTYESMYKRLGYIPVVEKTITTNKEIETSKEEINEVTIKKNKKKKEI